MKLSIENQLEVGSLEKDGTKDIHSIYITSYSQDVNSFLKNLLDDEYSNYAELKLVIDSNDEVGILVASFKKIKLNDGKYTWIVI